MIARPQGIDDQPGWPVMRSAKRSNQPMTGTMFGAVAEAAHQQHHRENRD